MVLVRQRLHLQPCGLGLRDRRGGLSPIGNINTTAQSGNLCADPEGREIGDDNYVCNLRLAVNRSVKKGDSYEEEASFFDVTVFGNFGKLVDSKARKGDRITVTGYLKQDRWETPDGNRSKVVIIAQQIDGECMFKKADDVPAKTDQPAAEAAAAAAGPSDDDIPF